MDDWCPADQASGSTKDSLKVVSMYYVAWVQFV